MKFPLFQIDAFTGRLFGGNPAAVVLLDEWLPDETLQAIGAENNLSETAFVVPGKGVFGLRWFTPTVEVDLCGHATLASAYVLFLENRVQGDTVRFETREAGELTVRREGDLLHLDFPSRPPEPSASVEGLEAALGATPAEVHTSSRDLLALFAREEEILALAPDFDRLAALEAPAVIATAPGIDADFVSRFFAPKLGVAEDPVTGSAHCTLIPYWAKRLGKTKLRALQRSRRGGEVFCEDRGQRVLIGGRAVEYLRGEITI